MSERPSAATIAALTGADPRDLALYHEALTHGSSGAGDYQRLEFLGDRVLGLVIASELFRRFPKAAEGELWFFFLPLPTGGSIGFRHHIDTSDDFDVAIAGRVGGVSAGLDYTDTNGNSVKNEATAEYGAAQAVLQLKHGPIRPLVSINLMPFHVKRTPGDDPVQTFTGIASSATLGLMLVGRFAQFGPYITVTNFESSQFSGGTFASGGLMLAFRPDRSRPKEPPPPPYTPPPYTPGPYAPPPYAPPPPMYPQPAPQPYPPPPAPAP